MTDERDSRLAAERLPGDLAQRWTALLRPCLRLRRAEADEQTVAALGGAPELPAGAAWPEWPGHGPLSFVASMRCAALPREAAFVSVDDPETWAGAQVLYIPEHSSVFPADTPPVPEPFPRVDLTADAGRSAPDLWLPQARKALLGDTRPWPHPCDTPAELKAFGGAFGRLREIGRDNVPPVVGYRPQRAWWPLPSGERPVAAPRAAPPGQPPTSLRQAGLPKPTEPGLAGTMLLWLT